MSSDSHHDYYGLLGIDPQIGSAELRRVWRRLAHRWHPDHAGHAATVTFQNLAAAYEVLSDPLARAAYDRRRRIRLARISTPPKGSAAGVPRRKAPGVFLRRLCGPLNSLVACGAVRFLEGEIIEILPNAREAASGGMITISLRVALRCPACAGNPMAQCGRCENRRNSDELFSAWLALPPGVQDGTVLSPSALLPGMHRPPTFRVSLASRGSR